MREFTIGDVIRTLKDEVTIEIAETRELVQQAYRLRYQVYCVDRGFEAGSNGMEKDQYDSHSEHAVLRLRQSREVVGAVRLILPQPHRPESLPIRTLCEPGLLQHLPAAKTGEVSRFALVKQRHGVSPASCSLLRLALIQGALWLSVRAGHTHWTAMMEPTLLRLLRGTGLHFNPVGPLVEHHGMRQPSWCDLREAFDRMQREQPEIWHFVTRNGSLVEALAEPAERMEYTAAA